MYQRIFCTITPGEGQVHNVFHSRECESPKIVEKGFLVIYDSVRQKLLRFLKVVGSTFFSFGQIFFMPPEYLNKHWLHETVDRPLTPVFSLSSFIQGKGLADLKLQSKSIHLQVCGVLAALIGAGTQSVHLGLFTKTKLCSVSLK